MLSYRRFAKRILSVGGWWRGLDSNQRTLARADLQSAAFNHSATSPGEARRGTWPRACVLSIGRASRRPWRSKDQPCPRHGDFGAGEGNRTLVVSLEGFCSTIELHPLAQADAPMPLPACT